jgi:hypothetical protein
MPTLLLTGARQGQRLALQGDRVVLGRDASCDIVLDGTVAAHAPAGHSDVCISRRHAVIARVGGRYYIEGGDGQGGRSRNGTSVNDRRLPCPMGQPEGPATGVGAGSRNRSHTRRYRSRCGQLEDRRTTVRRVRTTTSAAPLMSRLRQVQGCPSPSGSRCRF